MPRTSRTREKAAARGGKRTAPLRRARPAQPPKPCPNPDCAATVAEIEELSQIARDVAPADIKLKLDENPAKHCRRCGLVFVRHARGPGEPVGYFNRPGDAALGPVEGWEPPYPYHLTRED